MNCIAILIVGFLLVVAGCGKRSSGSQVPSSTNPPARDAASAEAPVSQPSAWSAVDALSDPVDYARIVDACLKYLPAPDTIVFPHDGGSVFVPEEWEALNPTSPHSGLHRASMYGSVIFMHGRRTPRKRQLLILTTWPDGGDQGLRVTLVELDRNDPTKRREVSTLAITRGVLLAIDDPQPWSGVVQQLRFFAGQPDPQDESAWTIRYTVAADQESEALPGLIQMKLTGEPVFATYDGPMRRHGRVPMQISVHRPDGTTWTN